MAATAYIHSIVVPAAMALLPPKFNTAEARAQVMAHGLQESRFEHRSQIGGPAEGFWQFESGGGWKGVLTHPASKTLALNALQVMAYGVPDLDDFYAVENNDILACVFARLLLWTHPKRLPLRGEHDYAWSYYIDTWRPGKPHRATWNAFYDEAWRLEP